MKIASSIADLLFEHECIVIPGLGGFITKTNPASIHPVKHQFKPPHKEIVFNQHLRANDGMLLNHIAHKEALSYSEAKSKMDKFVHRCLEEMQAGRRINFRNIGSLSMDERQQIIFEPDLSQNYLADSFGLSGFVSPAIKRESFTQKLEQQIKQQREEKSRKLSSDLPGTAAKKPKQKVFRASRKKNPYKKQIVFLAVLLIFMLGGWAYMNKTVVQQYYQAYAGLVPFFYANPNEYVAAHMDKLDFAIPNTKTNTAIKSEPLLDKTSNTVVENPVAEPLPTLSEVKEENTSDSSPVKELADNTTGEESTELDVTTEEVMEESAAPITENVALVAQQSDLKYFIIAGAFREKANADNLIAALKGKGFSAVFAGQTGSGLHRVAFEGHFDKDKALLRLNAIKEEENENAWLFTMK